MIGSEVPTGKENADGLGAGNEVGFDLVAEEESLAVPGPGTFPIIDISPVDDRVLVFGIVVRDGGWLPPS